MVIAKAAMMYIRLCLALFKYLAVAIMAPPGKIISDPSMGSIAPITKKIVPNKDKILFCFVFIDRKLKIRYSLKNKKYKSQICTLLVNDGCHYCLDT